MPTTISIKITKLGDLSCQEQFSRAITDESKEKSSTLPTLHVGTDTKTLIIAGAEIEAQIWGNVHSEHHSSSSKDYYLNDADAVLIFENPEIWLKFIKLGIPIYVVETSPEAKPEYQESTKEYQAYSITTFQVKDPITPGIAEKILHRICEDVHNKTIGSATTFAPTTDLAATSTTHNNNHGL